MLGLELARIMSVRGAHEINSFKFSSFFSGPSSIKHSVNTLGNAARLNPKNISCRRPCAATRELNTVYILEYAWWLSGGSLFWPM